MSQAIVFSNGLLTPLSPALVGVDPWNTSPEPNWYAVFTTPRHEKRVAQHFEIRGIDYFLPIYNVQRKWNNGARVALELPLFPNYIFVRAEDLKRSHVLSVPGVLSLVLGAGGKPAILPEEQIELFRHGLAERRVEPYPRLTSGQRARIRTGSMAGLEGIVVRVKTCYRVVLTVELIMKSIAVEVDAGDLELLDAASPQHEFGSPRPY